MSLTFRENATCHSLASFPSVSKCPPHFDRSLCWHDVTLGQTGYRKCPFKFCTAIEGCLEISQKYMAARHCSPSGFWNNSDYDQCLEVLNYHKQCISGYCSMCPDYVREAVINVSLALSIISVGLLVAALILFSLFDSIQCRRLSIHKNLAFAFVFRFTFLALWTVSSTSNFFKDCSQYNPIPLKGLEIYCKIILWLVIYFQVASVIWMLIEGAYLLSRFTVFAMRSEAPYYVYLLCGWGVPLIVVSAWTLIHEQHSRANGLYCWMPYSQGSHLWILASVMGLALILNVVVLLAIVIILIQKLQTENSAESKKIWRTVKATILLVPLLGVSNIPLFYEPEKPGAIYMLCSAILQHSQGIFIAVLYCFCNGEVQGAIRRQMTKLPFNSVRNRFSQRVRFEATERTYVPNPETNINLRHGLQMEELNNQVNTDLPTPSSNNNAYTNPTASSPHENW